MYVLYKYIIIHYNNIVIEYILNIYILNNLYIFRSKCKLREWCNTDLYIKPTDGHLHYQSVHLLHIKTSALRVSRIFSSENNFKTHVSPMKEWFLARGSLEIDVNNQIDKVVFSRDQCLKKLWKLAFLLLPPIPLRLISLESWLGIIFLQWWRSSKVFINSSDGFLQKCWKNNKITWWDLKCILLKEG